MKDINRAMSKMINKFFLLSHSTLIVALLVLYTSCSHEHDHLKINSNKFIANILDLKGVPSTPQDRSISSFCDLGAWHAFALPTDNAEFYGGFIGPFVMNRENGIWLGKKFAHLSLYDKNNKKIKYTSAVLNQYPGYLEQKLSTEIEGLEVHLKLWFQTNTSIIVSAKIDNKSQKNNQVYVGWEGDTWLKSAGFQWDKNLKLSYSDSESTHSYLFDRGFKIDINDTNKSYSCKSETILNIEPKSSLNINLKYTIQSKHDEDSVLKPINDSIINSSYNKTLSRWASYHNAFPYRGNHWLDSLSFEILKSKSIQTLVTNWKGASGELKYDGLFPSYLYKGFHGFWAWDSWKHAVALARFEPELAKNQMLTMFSYQNEEGMIPDCIFRDTLIEKHNWRDTKPPLATWAVNEIYEKTSDTLFASLMFPKLLKYHNWWYKNRDHDGNKLCEYGSTDGTRIAAAWESGMDNAVRFDHALMVKNNPTAWSLNQESVDLNAYLLVEKELLIKLAKITNNTSSIETLQNDANEVSVLINMAFYDVNAGYYFDRQLEDSKTIDVIGPEGWLPLWAGIATSSMAESVKSKVLDEALFNSKIPFPTLNISHKDFDPEDGYWRGPVWLDQAYFGIVGLERYGYTKEANDLKLKLVKNAEGLLEKGYPIRENYHPISGKGLNANHFSWSAAHLLLLIE
ncbi:MGH1-like glycoside hydrolase domain-containing protein [Flavivirga spongiicola]|uniref:Trehalase family glycosidase n=1 Tax=Flavivirga spongiicola TaxID=421621 RepID=A0ABU7XQ52_9FLAO|nr:trehalase family glycosidase [Flavivirga sp. MEBiC05379]MDO5977875.1 trehalase family glycosidase [Flavivirga sp. MEBiC05379]